MSKLSRPQVERTPGQRLLKKYRNARMKMLRRKEYHRLRSMVPSVASKPKVSKVTVIEEAIKYIDHLHGALLSRLQARQHDASAMHAVHQATIRAIVHQLIQADANRLPVLTPVCERTRRVASYLHKAERLHKRKSNHDGNNK